MDSMSNPPAALAPATSSIERRQLTQRVRLAPRPAPPAAMMPPRADDFAAGELYGPKPVFRRRRPLCFQALLVVVAAAISSFLTYSWAGSNSTACTGPSLYSTNVVETIDDVLRGDPTPKFRDNLFKNRKYITTWLSAGWTNDVMTIANLIHLGLLTGRTTILPPFAPSHVGRDAPLVPFSEIFDVPRMSATFRQPFVEWHEVKDIDSTEIDTLGCWSVWDAVRKEGPRDSLLYKVQNLDISYTSVPEWAALGSDSHVTFARLSKLGFPEWRSRSLSGAKPSPLMQTVLEPDEQLLCYDFLYFVSTDEPYEYEHDYAPAWHNVMTHIHWNPTIQDMADNVIRTVLGLAENAVIPPFISVHVRHGDFGEWCIGDDKTKCYAPLRTWEKHAEEVRVELRQRGVRGALPVIVTSDETSETWWADVAAKGWHRVDHGALRTAERFGRWYPVFLDAAIQSSGTGFLGTMKSTMSLLAKRRVEDWQNGVGRMVVWNPFNEHPSSVLRKSINTTDEN